MMKNAPGELSKIIRNIDDLPTLPRTVLKITELVNSPQASAKDLAKVITDDQVLTARLLKLVNSSFYGFPRKITTVTGAIVLLGFDAIRNLLLTTSIFDMFSKTKKSQRIRQEAFWDHSLGCAVGSKIIGEQIRHDKVEELFVSGLLHDIGKIVEMLFLPDDFLKVMSLVEEKNMLMTEAEEEVLGYNHTVIGMLLAKKWKIPLNLVNVIAHHQQPELAGQYRLEASVVHLADILCRALSIGSGGDNRMPPLNREAWEILHIKTSSLEEIMAGMEKEFNEISFFMNESS